MVSLTACFEDYSRCRKPQRASFPVHGDHITPVLKQLHWLPVRQRVQYKLTFLVYQSLRGLTPLYLSDECQLATVGGHRELRSADVITCHVPRTQTKFGDRGPSRSLDLGSGTVHRHLCDCQTMDLMSSRDYLRHICLSRLRRTSDQ